MSDTGNAVAIIRSCRTRLVDYAVIDSDRIYITADGRAIAHTLVDVDFQIWLSGPSPYREFPDTAGRVDSRLQRTLFVRIRSRGGLDDINSDEVWLTGDTKPLADEQQQNFGHYFWQERVIDALHIWEPYDEMGDHLTAEPIRLQGGGDTAKDPNDKTWGESTLQFEIVYRAALFQPTTTPAQTVFSAPSGLLDAPSQTTG